MKRRHEKKYATRQGTSNRTRTKETGSPGSQETGTVNGEQRPAENAKRGNARRRIAKRRLSTKNVVEHG
jgi:hypothetical protein